MNLVVSAMGFLGGEVCRALVAKGMPVRGLARETSDPHKVDQLSALGVEIVRGDLRDRASLDRVCRGVDVVISTITSVFSYQPGENDFQRLDREGVVNLIDAAHTAGVKHFIYTSFSGNLDLDFPLRNAKRAVEQYLKDSGLTYTILRPSYFMESWLSPLVGFDPAGMKATIYGTGSHPISWISRQDVASFAVESVTNPAARNATLELGGPETLTPLQVVKIFEEVAGRPFDVSYVPVEALEEQQKAAADPLQQTFLGLMRCYAQGDLIDMHKIQKAFPVHLTTVREYAQHVLAPV